MGKAGRNMQVGDYAITDFNKGTTLVRIVTRIDGTRSQSGVCFVVDPALRNCEDGARIDADWFEPAPESFKEYGIFYHYPDRLRNPENGGTV